MEMNKFVIVIEFHFDVRWYAAVCLNWNHLFVGMQILLAMVIYTQIRLVTLNIHGSICCRNETARIDIICFFFVCAVGAVPNQHIYSNIWHAIVFVHLSYTPPVFHHLSHHFLPVLISLHSFSDKKKTNTVVHLECRVSVYVLLLLLFVCLFFLMAKVWFGEIVRCKILMNRFIWFELVFKLHCQSYTGTGMSKMVFQCLWLTLEFTYRCSDIRFFWSSN